MVPWLVSHHGHHLKRHRYSRPSHLAGIAASPLSQDSLDNTLWYLAVWLDIQLRASARLLLIINIAYSQPRDSLYIDPSIYTRDGGIWGALTSRTGSRYNGRVRSPRDQGATSGDVVELAGRDCALCDRLGIGTGCTTWYRHWGGGCQDGDQPEEEKWNLELHLEVSNEGSNGLSEVMGEKMSDGNRKSAALETGLWLTRT